MECPWYAAHKQTGEKAGPFSQEELKALLESGQFSPEDMAWHEGWTAWKPLREIAEFSAQPPSLPPERMDLPPGLLGWMNFVGVMNILSGLVSCLGCVSAITGILMIISGAALLSAKSALESVQTVPSTLSPFFDKIRLFMIMSGVIYISLLAGLLIAALFFSSVILAALAS